uniref:Uncharacterized protein n=1 Tax=Bactrocera latifrons TaxID=174628 RepID=A0A0K8UPK4_BACLA
MTDYVKASNEATQTLLPRIPGDIFLNTYLANYGKVNELKNGDVIEKYVVSADYPKVNKKLHYKSDDSMGPGLEKSVSNNEIDTKELRKSRFRPNLQQPTLLSWNFEYGDLAADNNSQKFVPYAIQANHSQRSFISPQQESSIYHGDSRYYIGKDCELFLLSIDELLQEINRLVDIIDDNTSANKYYNKGTTESVHFKHKPLFIPSEKWLPIIIKEQKQLEDMTKEINI